MSLKELIHLIKDKTLLTLFGRKFWATVVGSYLVSQLAIPQETKAICYTVLWLGFSILTTIEDVWGKRIDVLEQKIEITKNIPTIVHDLPVE